MKIRNIPFGYALENGEIVLHGKEAQAVKDIFLRYLQGSSLQAVADIMDIPYSAASPDWSKHKVKRVLDNPRYTGLNGYPALVSAGDYEAVQRLKTEKNVCVPIPYIRRNGDTEAARILPNLREPNYTLP